MSQHWHDICDRLGLLVWDEIPLVNEIRDTPEFTANAQQQMREMIAQLNNHPGVAFWGLFNELENDPTPPPDNLLETLKAIARNLDGTRPIVGASDHYHSTYNKIPDFIAFNSYLGWYGGSVADVDAFIESRYRDIGHRVALSEYGAGGDPTQHQEGAPTRPLPTGHFHPEEYEDFVHEQTYAQIKGNPHLWGSFFWVMFDFASNSRNEGTTPDTNDKGVVTHDHKLRKDAFFFYQANWAKKPMIYIASRRMVERHQPATEVRVYSNAPSVELIVDGHSFGVQQPDAVHVFRWENVALKVGINHIRAMAQGAGIPIQDNCDWALLPTTTK